MNSSDAYGNKDLTCATPIDKTTVGTSTSAGGTPNTSQSSISPEFTGRSEEDDNNVATSTARYGGDHDFPGSILTKSYATPSRRHHHQQQQQPMNDPTTHPVTTTTWESSIIPVDATTTVCFPLDLDLVSALQNHSMQLPTANKLNLPVDNNNSQDCYSIDELQMISRTARGQLMELTVSREGRELQRWEYLGAASSSTIPTTTSTIATRATTPTQGCSFSSNDKVDGVGIETSSREQLIYNQYPNCRLTTGCIPILPGGKIILISSSKSQNVYVLPKGGWEHDESLPLSALRETLEEAGVTGLLGPPLPSLTYETKKSVNRRLVLQESQKSTSTIGSTASSDRSERIVTSESPVSVYHTHNRLTIFPMYVQCIYDHWPEMNRLRRIVTIDEASILLQHRPEFLHMICALRDRNLHQIGDV
jgi:ADP-ribose pyrophosphatase YjhB (NUDIX family)